VRNHGNSSNGTNNSRSLSQSQKPWREMFVTSTAEVELPRGSDVLLMRLYDLL